MRRTEASVTGVRRHLSPARDRTRRPGVACGRCGWEEASACRIDPAREDMTDRSRTRVQGSASRQPHHAAVARRARLPSTARCRSSPSTTNSTGPATSTAGPRPGPGRGLGGVVSGHRHRPSVASLECSQACSAACREGQQGGAAVASRHQHGRHVAGLVVGSPSSCSTSPRATTGTSRRRVLQLGQHGPWASRSPGAASYAASAAASPGSASPIVAGEAGIRDRTHPHDRSRAAVRRCASRLDPCPSRSPSTAPPGRRSR